MNTTSTWNGEQWAKPQVFLKKNTIAELCTNQGYRIPEEVEELLPTPQSTGETFLLILVHSGKLPEAVDLLSHLILPRVGVWWLLRCYHEVMKDIRTDFEKDGLTPKQRRKKHVDELVKKLSDSSEIDQMIEEHKRCMEQFKKKKEQEIKDLNPLNPVQVVADKIGDFQKAMNEIGISFDDPTPMSAEQRKVTDAIKKEMLEAIEKNMAAFMPPDDNITLPPELEAINGDRIFEKIKEKTDAIKPTIENEMAKHFPLKLRGLPPAPSQKKKDAAVSAAQRWLLAPTDDNGNLACQAAIEAQNGPEAMLAYTAFWSATNLKTDSGIVPSNPALPPLGISKTLLQLALLEGGEKDYDARYEEFLNIGLNCSDGTSTWDAYGHEVNTNAADRHTAEDAMLTRRFAFGRDLQPPSKKD